MTMRVVVSVLAVLVLVLAGCAGTEPVASATGSTNSAAAAYCTDSGGEVQQRQPAYGTNNDMSAWVSLGQPIATCKFVSDTDATAIFVDVATLYADNPTLAALAYLQSTAPKDLTPSGNPAAAICAALGGTSAYGPGANGGGLTDTDDTDFPVIAPCMFADGSFIEEWGIAYHQDGTIRGADLAPLFRFDAASAPQVFG